MPFVELRGIRLIVFDLDDTLYPERMYTFSGFDHVGAWLNARLPCPFDPALRMRELFAAGEHRRVFDALLTELGCVDSPSWVRQMVDEYRAHRPSVALHQDAEDALRRWSGRFKTGLISDGPLQSQQRKIEALELSNRLDWIVLTDQWGPPFWKPHVRGYEEVERFSGIRGRECVYVADNAAKDFVGARALGWQTVRLRRPEGIYADSTPPAQGQPEHEINSLADLTLDSL